jgi:hypothetical protein
MEAPTAAAQKVDETPLTYLNKGIHKKAGRTMYLFIYYYFVVVVVVVVVVRSNIQHYAEGHPSI